VATIAQICWVISSQLRHVSTIGKNLLSSNMSSRCPHNIVNFGPLAAAIDLPVWGTFQRLSRLGFITAAMSFAGGQPNFARCLAVSWAGALCRHFRGLLPPNGISPHAKFTLRPSLAFSHIGSITARRSSSGRQPNFAARYKEWNYRTFAKRAIYIRLGGHHVGRRPTF